NLLVPADLSLTISTPNTNTEAETEKKEETQSEPKGKGKEKEADNFEDPEADSEETCKRIKKDRNGDDESQWKLKMESIRSGNLMR
ncbi:hypothetical protein Tco_1276751, partial [Tanacetum coccineum]